VSALACSGSLAAADVSLAAERAQTDKAIAAFSAVEQLPDMLAAERALDRGGDGWRVKGPALPGPKWGPSSPSDF
jgi:hypothetical protein